MKAGTKHLKEIEYGNVEGWGIRAHLLGSSPQPLDDAWMNREVKAQECKFIWASSLHKVNYSLYFPKQIHDELIIENWLGSFKFPSFSLVTKIRVLTEINRAGYLPQFTFSLCSTGINSRGEDGNENMLVGNMKLSISFWGTQVNMTMHSCQKKEHCPFPRYREEKAAV